MGVRASKVPVAVLGAGLTGMSAAHFLRAAGIERRIFEKLDRPGGHAVTVEEQGWRFDRTGHLLHVKDPELRALAVGWMGRDHREIRARQPGVVARRLHALPVPGQRARLACRRGLRVRDGVSACEGGWSARALHGLRALLSGAVRGRDRRALHDPLQHARLGRGTSRDHRRLGDALRAHSGDRGCHRGARVGHGGRELGYNARFLYPGLGIRAAERRHGGGARRRRAVALAAIRSTRWGGRCASRASR